MNLNQVTLTIKHMNEATKFYLKLAFTQIVDTPHYARFECPDRNSTFSLELNDLSNSAVVCFENERLDQWVADLKSLGIKFDQ